MTNAPTRPHKLALLLTAGVALIGLAGCGSTDPDVSLTERRLRRVATVYLNYAVATGVGPANEQVLRSQMSLLAPPMQVAAHEGGASSHEAAFRSQLDGESFVIRYGLRLSMAEGADASAIAFETKGRDDRRFIAFANGSVLRVSEKKAKKILARD